MKTSIASLSERHISNPVIYCSVRGKRTIRSERTFVAKTPMAGSGPTRFLDKLSSVTPAGAKYRNRDTSYIGARLPAWDAPRGESWSGVQLKKIMEAGT